MKRLSCELLVVGGGVSGVCAAVAAARRGVRVILAERQGYLGGTGYAGMLQHLCGLFLHGDTFPEETLNGGLTEEIVGLLQKKSAAKPVLKVGRVYVLPYAASDLQGVLTALLESETAAILLRNSVVLEVETKCGTITNVTLETPAGALCIAAAMVIDGSGNGDVAAMAGAEYALSPLKERQLAGFSILVSGLKGHDDLLSLKVPYYCSRAVEQNIFPPAMKYTTFSQGNSSAECFIKMSLEGDECTDRDEQALKSAHRLLTYLGQVLPVFRDVRITATSHKVLDREGRRILGDYLLTEEDVLLARKFPDAVVRNCWPIELWDRAMGTLYKYVPAGDYYEIPFRCLTVRGISNLLTAGRCISVSSAALGSTRVMGTCMSLGEQAGLAAADYIRSGEFRTPDVQNQAFHLPG